MRNIKFKYCSYNGNVYAHANLPTSLVEKLRKLLENGTIPHKDNLYYPHLAYGSVVFWSYKGISPKTNKRVEIVGCIDALINEISIEYLDNRRDNDMFKSSRRTPKSIAAREEIDEQLSCGTEPPAPEPDPDEDEYDLPF